MGKINFLLLIFTVFLSCDQTEQKESNKDSLVNIKQDSIKNETHLPIDSLNQSLSPSSDTTVFHLKMDTANQHVTVPVKISSGNELNASLSSDDKKANIRISQVGLPDSTFDGPFGRDLHYKIKTPGNYKIIIGEDMMAGSRWTGDFVLKVSVK